MKTRPFLCALAALLLSACRDDPPPPAPTPEPVPVRRVSVAAPRPLASLAAFDIVWGSEGAMLVYGPPSSRGGGLRAQRVDSFGGAVGEERVLIASGSGAELLPEVVEVAAATNGGRMRVGYVLRDQLTFTAHFLALDDTAESIGEPVLVGATARPGSDVDATGQSAISRGSMAMSARAGALELLMRAEDGPCVDGQRDRCGRFMVSRPGSDVRRGAGYSVPSLCPRAVVGYVEQNDVLYQALCAREGGRPTTTVFAIQFEPQYAHAEPILDGCSPRGLTALRDGVLVRGSCPPAVEAGAPQTPQGNIDTGVFIAEAGRDVRTGRIGVRCVDGRPRVEHPGGTTSFREGRDRVEALLPDAIVGANARALWTGESLLVAEPLGREVALRRYECVSGTLVRNDHV